MSISFNSGSFASVNEFLGIKKYYTEEGGIKENPHFENLFKQFENLEEGSHKFRVHICKKSGEAIKVEARLNKDEGEEFLFHLIFKLKIVRSMRIGKFRNGGHNFTFILGEDINKKKRRGVIFGPGLVKYYPRLYSLIKKYNNLLGEKSRKSTYHPRIDSFVTSNKSFKKY